MPPLTVIARIKAKPGKEDVVRTALLKLIDPTRAEAGCMNYDLHVSQDDPGLFYFHENWTSPQDLHAHFESDHFKAGLAELHETFDTIDIQRLSRIG